MKNNFTLALIFLPAMLLAQINPIDFEPTGIGADWTWTVFENDTNPPLEIIVNPVPGGINTSQSVAKFTALSTGMPFAGCETMHGADIGTFTLTPDNAFVAIMVYKTEISDVGIKFATLAGASTGEIKVPNTVVNQWERLIFDFTPVIGEPSNIDIDQLIVFPDFQARTSDNIIYFDNIEFGDFTLAAADQDAPADVFVSPNPVLDVTRVHSAAVIDKLEVYNVLGQQVGSYQPNSTNFNLDLQGLKSGIYVLSLQAGNSTSQLRIVKL